jgi:RNA polymerase sigma-70 factor (ECF subfamily)
MEDFRDFYAARKDPVLRAVLVSTGDRVGAEDAVAEAFTRALARWAQVREHPSPTAWVTRTALNTYRSWWRRLRGELLGGVPDEPARVRGAEPGGIDGELRRLIAALPTRQREAVALRILADLSPEEAASVLGISPATVNVHLHRALAALRGRLAEGATAEEQVGGVVGEGELS